MYSTFYYCPILMKLENF